MTALHSRSVDRPAIVRFVHELETAYAKEWPEKSARWIIEQILTIRPDTETLTDAALRIERGSKWLPSPSDVVTSIADTHREAVRYEQTALPADAVEKAVAPFLAEKYPDESVTWSQHIAKIHAELSWCDRARQRGHAVGHPACHSPTCELHRSTEQITEHEKRVREETA